MIYHIDPVTTQLGKHIPGLFQVHTQEENDLKWDFKAVVQVTQDDYGDFIIKFDGFLDGCLNRQEELMVIDRAASLNWRTLYEV